MRNGPRYDPFSYGRDAYDHPVDMNGRCAFMDAEPPVCPPNRGQRARQLAQWSDVVLMEKFIDMGFALEDGITRGRMISEIVRVENLAEGE